MKRRASKCGLILIKDTIRELGVDDYLDWYVWWGAPTMAFQYEE